jgi:hypothetical protein
MAATSIPMPGATGRAVFVGKTGCGKTTLAYRVVQRYQHAMVLDIKGEMTAKDWPGFQIFDSLEKLVKADTAKVPKRIYQPGPGEMDSEHYEKFFRWIYERKNTAVYIDEVLGLCRNWADMGFYYRAILTRGRQRQIACLQATQTPMDIPREILGQSEFYYVFFTKMPADRKKIEEITGIPRDEQAALNDYEFLVATDREYWLQKRRLNLGE